MKKGGDVKPHRGKIVSEASRLPVNSFLGGQRKPPASGTRR